MLDKVADILTKVNLDIWTYIFLGIVGLSFIVGLIISLAGGEFNKIKSVEKKFKKKPTFENAMALAKIMPLKVRKQFKASVRGGKPSDFITADACVTVPFLTSVTSKFSKAMGFISAFCTAMIFFVGNVLAVKVANVALSDVYTACLLVAAAGLVFTLLAGLISRACFSGAVMAYNEYVDGLDKLKSGAPLADESDEIKADAEVSQVVTEPMDLEADVIPSVPGESPRAFSDFDDPSKITVELADEEPLVEVETPVYEQAEAIEIVDEQAEAQAEADRARAREEELIRAREEQTRAAERARAEQHAQERIAEQRAQAIAAAQARAAAKSAETAAPEVKPEPVEVKDTAGDVIARIEKINKEGAPLSTMKEVALALQQERAKPENKSPEQQRRLNEALASLLKAMSSATRK